MTAGGKAEGVNWRLRARHKD